MRLGDIQLSIPFILLVIAFIAALGSSLTNTILILGLASWVTYARVVRGEVLRLRDLDYIQAANALGASAPRRLLRHILPNTLGPLLVVLTLEFARLVIAEAALSFLGCRVFRQRRLRGGNCSRAGARCCSSAAGGWQPSPASPSPSSSSP